MKSTMLAAAIAAAFLAGACAPAIRVSEVDCGPAAIGPGLDDYRRQRAEKIAALKRGEFCKPYGIGGAPVAMRADGTLVTAVDHAPNPLVRRGTLAPTIVRGTTFGTYTDGRGRTHTYSATHTTIVD